MFEPGESHTDTGSIVDSITRWFVGKVVLAAGPRSLNPT